MQWKTHPNQQYSSILSKMKLQQEIKESGESLKETLRKVENGGKLWMFLERKWPSIIVRIIIAFVTLTVIPKEAN